MKKQPRSISFFGKPIGFTKFPHDIGNDPAKKKPFKIDVPSGGFKTKPVKADRLGD